MNNRGQVLIIFLLLIPVLFLFAAVLVDSSIILTNKSRLDNISRDILNTVDYEKITEDEISTLISINDSDIVLDDIYFEDKTITIKSHKLIKSVFGNIIGKDFYIVKSNINKTYKTDLILRLDIKDGIVSNDKYTIKDNILSINENINNRSITFTFKNTGNGNLFNYDNLDIVIKDNNIYIDDELLSNIYENNKLTITYSNNNINIYLNTTKIYDKNINFKNSNIKINNKFNINKIRIYDRVLKIDELGGNYGE